MEKDKKYCPPPQFSRQVQKVVLLLPFCFIFEFKCYNFSNEVTYPQNFLCGF